jgi:hypothetical protein
MTDKKKQAGSQGKAQNGNKQNGNQSGRAAKAPSRDQHGDSKGAQGSQGSKQKAGARR